MTVTGDSSEGVYRGREGRDAVKRVVGLSATDSILLGIAVLLGEKDKDYELPESDTSWWKLRMWIRRN